MSERYRDVPCPDCGRKRVQQDGICERCGWNVDAVKENGEDDSG